MQYYVDLNADVGESFGAYTLGMDSEVMQHISSANIACGWHAGDPMVLDKTVSLAKTYNVAIGAHPGYPDLMGFGRRNMVCSEEEIEHYVTYQLGAFYAFATKYQLPIQHVKAHGAMYNMAGKDIKQAMAIVRAVRAFDPSICLLALAGSKMVEAAGELGMRCASEFFADRAYEADGSLVARTKEGAMITDEAQAIARVIRAVKEKKVQSISGQDIPITCDSICVHGDNAHAVAFVQKIRKALTDAGICVAPFGKWIG